MRVSIRLSAIAPPPMAGDGSAPPRGAPRWKRPPLGHQLPDSDGGHIRRIAAKSGGDDCVVGQINIMSNPTAAIPTMRKANAARSYSSTRMEINFHRRMGER